MRPTCLLLVLAAPCFAQNARQLNYLDENNPYYPGLKFPKLITPQWVGEEGVDAVIILGIDDMRDTAKEPHLVIKRTFAEILAAGKKVGWAPPANPNKVASAEVSGKALVAGRATEQTNVATMPGASARPLTGGAGQTSSGTQVEEQSVVGNAHPTAKSPQASLNSIKVREGFKVELVAAEPLIHDPIAFDWLLDGRMIVVEMGGYPNGVEDKKRGDEQVRNGLEHTPKGATAGLPSSESQAQRADPSSAWGAAPGLRSHGKFVAPNGAALKTRTQIGFNALGSPASGLTSNSTGNLGLRPRLAKGRAICPTWHTSSGDPERAPCCGKVAEQRHVTASDFSPRYPAERNPQVAERRQMAPRSNTSSTHGPPAAAPRLSSVVHSYLGLKPEATAFRRSATFVSAPSNRTLGLRAPSTSDAPTSSPRSINSQPRSPLASNQRPPTLGLGGPKYGLTRTSFQPHPIDDVPTNGRVRILEDTDNDGVYDKATTFLDNLNFPTGVMPWKNGVLISAAPDIIYAEDTNGDGMADKREVLFTGFTEGNQQHRVNGFEYGLDNWVYIANGDSGGTIKSIKTGKTLDIRSNDLRVKPDTGEMERVTGRTQYGRHRDAYGNWFGCNNSNPMWHYVLDEKYVSRNKHFAPGSMKHVVPDVPGNAPIFPISTTPERFNDFHTANRFTSACSTIVYDDDLFGPHFKHNAFVCEPVHNLISRLVLEPNGVTFTGKRAIDEQDREFLASTDNWFRPVFVRTGPDGALWIADMYRHVIEHPEWIPDDWQKKLDLRAGHDKGRIYRVVPVTAKPMRELTSFPIKGEVKELDNPNRWVRDTVQRHLVRSDSLPKNGGEAMARLSSDWASLTKLIASKQPATIRLQALATLDGRDGQVMADNSYKGTPDWFLAALKDPEPAVRRQAIRMARHFGKSDEVKRVLVELAKDPTPQEMLDLAYRLGDIHTPEATKALAQLLARHGNDAYVTASILSGMNATNMGPSLELATQPGLPIQAARALFRTAALGSDETRLAAITAISNAHTKDRKYANSTRLLTVMAELLDHTSSQQFERLEKLDRVAPWVLLPMWGEATGGVLNSERLDPDRVIASVSMTGAILRFAGDTTAEDANLKNRLERDLTGPLLQPGVHPRVQKAAVDEVAKFGGIGPADLLLECWPRMTPTVRDAAFAHLLGRQEWTIRLLGAIEMKTIEVALNASQRQQLLDHRNNTIRDRASRILTRSMDSDRTQIIQRFSKLSETVGDATAGRAVFEKRCSTCHQLGGIGKQIGADLASLKDKSTKALLTAILDPNRAVETKFISYTLVTEAGKSMSGMIKSESGNAITLIGSDGKEQTVLRSDIEEFACSNKSLMPEGLEKDLTPEDLANVIAFVQSGTGATKPKQFAGNAPAVVRPENGTIRLTARNCQIHGPNLVYESHFGNLGHWASKDDHAIWTVEGLKPGRYKVLATVAAPANIAGQEFQLIAGPGTMTAKVVPTDSWNRYTQFEAGEIDIAAGTSTLRVQSKGQVREFLMDLRELLLVPVP